MKKMNVYSTVVLWVAFCICLYCPLLRADPSMYGGKGQLRVMAANNEPFYTGMPLLYLGFYQGYVNEQYTGTAGTNDRNLSHIFSLTFVVTSKIELSTSYKGLFLPKSDTIIIEHDSNEWKLKYLAFENRDLSIALAPGISFPIRGNEEAKSKFGAYLLGTIQSAMGTIPMEFNANIGGFSSEEFLLPAGLSASVLTKYSEFFIEYSAENLTGTETEMRITPGIRLNPKKGLTLLLALDKTFSTPYPDKRFNLSFSWLGPFAVFGAQRQEIEEEKGPAADSTIIDEK